MNLRLFATVLGILLVIASSPASNATSMAPYPKLASLKGIWVGPGSKGEYFRLELDKKGSGLLIINEDLADTDISIYKVSAVQLDKYSIQFVLHPVGEAEPVTLSGDTAGYDMKLERHGIGEARWSSQVTLEPEEFLLENLETVRKASKRFHSSQRI